MFNILEHSASVLLVVLIIIALASSTTSAEATEATTTTKGEKVPPAKDSLHYANSYLPSLQKCDDTLPSQWWRLNSSSSNLWSLVEYPINCLQIWSGLQGHGEPNHILTTWICNDYVTADSGRNNYWFNYNETLSTMQQLGTNQCVGFNQDAEFQLLRMYDCGNNKTALMNLTRVPVDPKKAGGEENIFTLRTGKNHCAGLPQQAKKTHTIKSDKIIATFGIEGDISEKIMNFTYLVNLQVFQSTYNKWSANLLDSMRSGLASHYSTSSTTLEDRSWHHARGGRFTTMSDTHVVIEDIQIGDFAVEKWNVFLYNETDGAVGLSWNIDRRYLRNVTEIASRFATMTMNSDMMTIGYIDASEQGQVPSTLDPSFQRNITNASSFYTVIGNEGTKANPENWVYAYSQKSAHWMKLSPADVCISWEKSAVAFEDSTDPLPYDINFAFQFPDYDNYPLGESAFGLLSMTQLHTPRRVHEGTHIAVGFNWTVSANGDHSKCAAGHKIDFSSGNKVRDERLRGIVRLFNMWSGNIFGNSPVSVSCIFESSFYSLIQSILTGDTTTTSSSSGDDKKQEEEQEKLPDHIQAMGYELTYLLENGVNMTPGDFYGHVISQIDNIGPLPYEHDGQLTMFQQQTQLLYSIHTYATFSGDKKLVLDHWKTIHAALEYLLNQMKMRETGLAYALGLSTGNAHPVSSSNWMDIVGFGGRDGIINSEAGHVLLAYVDLCTWIGETKLADELKALHAKMVVEFNKHFWNESFGMYADWIGDDGTKHFYGYVWQQANAVDPAAGLTGGNATRVKKILDSIDANYARVRKAFSGHDLWCTPTNFVNVPYKYQPSWDQIYPTYENGACFMLQSSFEIKLRFAANDTKGAFALMDRILEQFDKKKLWAQHYSWASDMHFKWQGGDVLTDTTMLVWAFLRGALRIRPTLTQGIVVDGNPGGELDGFYHVFWHQGKLVNASVVNGKTEISPSHHHGMKKRSGMKGSLVAGIVVACCGGLAVIALVVGCYHKKRREKEKAGGGEYNEVQ